MFSSRFVIFSALSVVVAGCSSKDCSLECPPVQPDCVDSTTVRTFTALAQCSTGCSYAPVLTVCAGTCVSGHCIAAGTGGNGATGGGTGSTGGGTTSTGGGTTSTGGGTTSTGGGTTSTGGGTTSTGGGTTSTGGGTTSTGGGTTSTGGGTTSTGGGTTSTLCEGVQCPQPGHCVPATGTCVCDLGYQTNGSVCSDINECTLSNGGCSVNALCENTQGGRLCTCRSGYQGDGLTCTDIDECATNNGGCDPNATCANQPATRTCTCKQGYAGDGLTCTRLPWTQFTGVTPAARRTKNLTYDAQRQRVVLYGGEGLDDTWEFDGRAWQQKLPVHSPGGRYDAAMTYDSARNRVVLFGGYLPGTATYANDTWLWDGADWVLASPTTKPPARAGHAMAFDSQRGRVVLFGGQLNDVWEWDGVTWTLALAASDTAPRAAIHHALAYDAAHPQVLMVGADLLTWSWNGSKWTALTPMPPESLSSGLAMTYDSVRNRVQVYTSSMFEWTGSGWVKQPYSSIGSGNYAMAFDAAHATTVLQATSGATWLYRP